MNPISVNPMAVVTEGLPEQVALLRAVGADQFGLTIGACREFGWENTLQLLGDSGGRLGYLCHGASARADDERSWRKEIVVFREAVEFAARAGASQIYFTTGRQGMLTWEQAAERVAEHLAPLVDHAGSRGVGITLENTLSLRSELSFTHSVRDTAALAAMTGAQLCVDLYCCWGEAGLAETLRANLDRIAMVQISDMEVGDLQQPNRRVPGDGDVPLEPLLTLVKELGYRGLIDIELIGPEIEKQGARQALGRSVEWLKNIWNKESMQ